MSPSVRLIALAASFLAVCVTGTVQAHGQAGPIHVVPKASAFVGGALALDGNTILLDGKTAIRLWGVEAPEISNWPWGPRARRQLDEILASSPRVLCEPKGQRLNRIEARCWLIDGEIQATETGYMLPAALAEIRDIGAQLIGAGYAVEYRSLTRGYPPYREREKIARDRRIGMWRD